MIKINRYGVALAAVLAVAGGPAFAASSVDALASRLDGVVNRAIDEHRIVGTVVLVAKDGNIVYHRAAGFADREAKRPMTETAIFRLASMTKPIVSATALALVQQGKLTLDDPVTKWLPEFRPKMADGRTPVITIQQLLTHTAGLSYHPSSPSGRGGDTPVDIDEPGIPMDERLRRIGRLELLFQPGTQWSYSYAIDVLGGVIATVTGRPLADAVNQIMMGPLSMKDTGFTVTDRARLATPYANGYAVSPRSVEPVRAADPQQVHADGVFGPEDFALSPSRVFVPESFPSGGGGMVGTAGDYLRFLETLRNGRSTVLNAGTVQSMMSNHIGEIQSKALGPGWGFGFGGAVLKDSKAANTPQLPGTWLWAGAFGNSFFVDPARKISVVALTNTTPEGAEGPFTLELRDAVYGRGRAVRSAW